MARLGGLAVFHLALALLLAPTACGNAKTCVPGQSVECTGASACKGFQVCNPDGAGYADCVCGNTDADAGSRPFAHTGPFSGLLGAACTSPDDCRYGLECVGSDSKLINGEGPSAGMCLSRCLVEHNLCNSVDATAKCIVLDNGGTADTSDDLAYCMPGCKIGDQPASADKCRARVDLVCTEYPTGAGAGYCRPSCRSNLDCAPRACDLGTGLCADSAPSGDPIGAACDSTNSNCAGGCIQQGPSFSACSGVCSYDTQGCGQNDVPPLDYYCSIDPATGAGPGDLGYCAKLCDCDDDCKRSDAVCESHHDLIAKAGRQGMCVSKLTSSGSARPGLPCK